MTANKLNLLLLPLLVSILLATMGKLKIGRTVDHVAYTILSPIQLPLSSLKYLLNTQVGLIKNLPQISKQNSELKSSNSTLLTENQNLKSLIKDQLALEKLSSTYKSSIPIRIVNTGNTISATTTLDFSQIVSGQPVVKGTSLIGIVVDVKKPIITIIPLSDDKITQLAVKTGLGQTGTYQFSSRTPQIINVPSENPVSLNDVVFTEASKIIPANLVIGKITKVLTSPESPLQKAEIKLDIDPSQYKDLFIITQF